MKLRYLFQNLKIVYTKWDVDVSKCKILTIQQIRLKWFIEIWNYLQTRASIIQTKLNNHMIIFF